MQDRLKLWLGFFQEVLYKLKLSSVKGGGTKTLELIQKIENNSLHFSLQTQTYPETKSFVFFLSSFRFCKHIEPKRFQNLFFYDFLVLKYKALEVNTQIQTVSKYTNGEKLL